ncbi:MAG: polysaccharide biosynthesis tyrosine autokinase [Pyrinomonadaceae bacterium]
MNEPVGLIKKPDDQRQMDRPLDAVPPPITLRYDAEPESEDGLYWRVHEYWAAARKHIWLIVGITLLITTLAAIYSARQPDVFEATAKVQVNTENTNPALGAFKSNNLVLSSSYTDPVYFNTQLQILTSAGLLARVVKTLDLEHNQDYLRPQAAQNRSTWESLKRMAGFGAKAKDEKPLVTDKVPLSTDLAPATSRDDLAEVNRLYPYVGGLQGGLSVKQQPDTRIINISFRHSDPQVAAKIANAVSQTFVTQNIERKTETGETAGDFLQNRIARLQSEIQQGEEQLNNYARNHDIISLKPEQNTVVERLSGLSRELLDAEKERIDAETAYRAGGTASAAEAQVDANAKGLDEAEAELSALKQKRAQLLIEYTPKYPEVQAVDAQIAAKQKYIDDTRSRKTRVAATNLRTRYEQAKSKEDTLRAAYERQRAEAIKQNEAAVNYNIMQQQIETNKSLLDGLLQRAKENDVVMAGTPNNINVVDWAPVPGGPIAPNRFRSVMLAFLISLVLGVALARYLEYLDDSIHTADEVEKLLRLPALAVIPAIGSLKKARGILSGNLSLQKRNADTPELLTDTSGRSPLAEAYRQLRTSVLLSSAGGAPQTILVTSSQPSEGKTTTVVNTAITLAQTGAVVLVIDADMRRPRVHTILGVENQRGLSTILASRSSEKEILEVFEYHKASGLYVLPAGPIPPNPAELLGSDQMRELLVRLRASFTHIVIDSPPIASFTDSVLLSTLVDGVLLVVHGGRASRNIIRRSKQLLQDVGARIFGVVLNNVTLTKGDDYYYQYYYDHNKYYSDSEPVEEPAVSAAASGKS